MAKPISPSAHGAIDYGFLALMTTVPPLLGLTGSARLLPRLFGGAQGALNAVTDHPLAVRRLVPFAVHGRVEKWGGPAFVALPLISGALRQPRARAFFGGTLLLLLANYNLTDWEATVGD
jgi:hypothetical protein